MNAVIELDPDLAGYSMSELRCVPAGSGSRGRLPAATSGDACLAPEQPQLEVKRVVLNSPLRFAHRRGKPQVGGKAKA